jgi:TRAP-type mannitol/chloroaromatic compound transport system substrate-binding protein
MELLINQEAFEGLPGDLQAIVRSAARVINESLLSEYIARNNQALQTLVNEHKVDVRRLPDEVLRRLKQLSDEVVAEVAEKDPASQKIYASFQAFRDQVVQWQDISERAYINARAL